MNASATKDPRIAEMEDNPEFSIKLGIIIGCTISAFCIVVLVLFIVWRNPCRLVKLCYFTLSYVTVIATLT